jgi:hypothetical protein
MYFDYINKIEHYFNFLHYINLSLEKGELQFVLGYILYLKINQPILINILTYGFRLTSLNKKVSVTNFTAYVYSSNK